MCNKIAALKYKPMEIVSEHDVVNVVNIVNFLLINDIDKPTQQIKYFETEILN